MNSHKDEEHKNRESNRLNINSVAFIPYDHVHVCVCVCMYVQIYIQRVPHREHGVLPLGRPVRLMLHKAGTDVYCKILRNM